MAKYEVKLVGKIDEQETSKKINDTIKKVNKNIEQVELSIDTKKIASERERVARLQSKNVQEQIKLNAQLATNINSNNESQLKSLQFIAKRKERILELMDNELRKQDISIEKLKQYDDMLKKAESRRKEYQVTLSANNQITVNKQSNTKAVGSAKDWSYNQETKVINELITLENKLANSKRLSRSSEAQALQTLLTQQRENIRLYQESIQKNGLNHKETIKYKKAIEDTTRAISTQKTSVKALENQSLNIWDKLTEKARDYFNYAVAAMTLQQAGQAVRSMINEVVELDSSLVELRKVTDLEGESLEAFTDKAYIAARDVAKTGREMIEATTEFAKSGYNPDDALGLGKIALMYGNIADEEVSAGESANFIIAQMKAFNIEAKDAMHIIDAVNEVSNNFAVSSADIANNLGKASAVMANAGNSMEEYIAMMTAITEITRSADKAANGLKTLTLRLQGMNDEGEKDLEVQAKMEELFNKLGISVYKSNGELKNTYEIMGSLAPVYKTLTNAEKAYVTETIAGKYQAQNAAALLNNWSQAVKANETAINSQGSAMTENAKVLDSIEGKINAFKSSFQELSKNLIGSDLIKGIVDLGNGFLQLLNAGNSLIPRMVLLTTVSTALWQSGSKLTNIFKILSSTIGLSTTKILANQLAQAGLTNTNIKAVKQIVLENAALKKNGIELKKKSLETIKAKVAALGLTQAEQDATIAAIEQTIALNGAKGATLSLSGAWKSLSAAIMSNPIGFALVAATTAFSFISSAISKAKQEEQEAIQKVVDDASEVDNSISEMNDTITRVEELRKVLDSSTSSYEESAKAREELVKIQQELRAQYGEEAKDIDLVTGSVSEQIKELKRLKQEKAKDYLEENEKAYNTAKKKINKEHQVEGDEVVGKYNNWGRSLLYMGLKGDYSIPETYSGMKNAAREYLGGTKMIIQKGTYDDLNKELTDAANYLKEHKEEIIQLYDIKEDYLNKEIKKIEDKAKEYGGKNKSEKKAVSEYESKLKDAKGFEQFNDEVKELAKGAPLTEEAIKELLKNYPELESAMKKSGITINSIIKDNQNYEKSIDNIGNAMGDDFTKDIQSMIYNNNLAKSNFDELLTKYPKLKTELDKYGISIEQFSNYVSKAVEEAKNWDVALQQWNTDMDKVQSSFQTLSSAQEEYNDNGFITIDTLQSLLALDQKYLDELVTQDGQIKLNTNAFKVLTQAKLDDLLATEEQRHYDAVYQLQQESLNSTVKEGTGWFKALWQAITGGKVSIESTKKSLKELEDEINNGTNETIKQKLIEENKLHNDRITLINKTKAGLKDVGTLLGGSKSKTSSKSEKEWWEKELQNLKDQFNYNEITIEEYINGLDKLLGKTKKGSEAWKKINEELQKQRLSKVEDDYKAGRISLDEYIKKLKELLKVYKQGTKAWNDLAEKIKKGLQDQAKETKTSYDDAKSAIDKVIDDEINKLQEEIDLLKEKNDEKERDIELTRLKDALENAKKNKNKRVWNGSEWVWMADQAAIDDAQKALDDFLLQDKTDALQKQIDDLNDLKNQYADVTKIYDQEQQKQKLIAMLGANAEADILNKRIDTLNKFKDKYLDIQKQIANYDKATPESLAGGSSPSKSTNKNSGTSSNNSNSMSQSEIDELARAVIRGKYGNGAARKSALGSKYAAVQARVNQMLSGRSYSSGGIVDYTGLAMLHGSPNRPEVVMNYDQVKKFMSMVSRPEIKSNISNNGQSIIYNFSGDFNLPNVNNAQQFLRDLKASVNINRHSI